MEKKTLHIIPHSHWDREWYMSFEQHRMRLVELFDTLIETMENHPEYKYYHMDGQYVVIEDYLEVRPKMRERLFKLINEDRIQIGPWYVLQDEYLTSGEANVRNMLYGIKLCREIGAQPVMTGYFPDAFGNISQAPQILKGFGVESAVFGRGVGAILEDNKVDPNASNNPSEIIWRSPDGSEVIGVMFVQWYHNAMELPTVEEKLKARLDKIIPGLCAATATPHILGMNGCDHQPVQANLHEAVSLAKTLYDQEELEIKHSNFKDFLASVSEYKEKFPLIEGEINGQRTAGAVPLIDTASTHIKIKQLNHRGQNILERIAEPLSTIAYLMGVDNYREDQLLFAWKMLMQNHPHDSICTCSNDAVAKEMEIRFEKSYEAARFIKDEALDSVMKNIDTSELSDMNITVFHTVPEETTGKVRVNLDYPEGTDIGQLTVISENGTAIPASFKKLGRTFTYTLPKDSFRKPRYVERVEAELLVTAKGIGYTTYKVINEQTDIKPLVSLGENGASNESIAFKIEQNGSVTITDLLTGEVYRNNVLYEDLGDVGESYNFRPAQNDIAITTADSKAQIRLLNANSYSATYEIKSCMDIPAAKVDKTRTEEKISHDIITRVTITAGIHRVDIETDFNNQSENHRLRALFCPDIKTEYALAEGQFEVIKREIIPYKTWKNPCYCQRHQAFFGLEQENRGLLVSVRGNNEYEILRDGKNTMALTLLRAIDQMGDWGYFPTPYAQCKGKHTFSYSIIPFAAQNRAQAFSEAYTFNGDPFDARYSYRQEGSLPANKLTVSAEASYMPFVAFKKSEERNSAVIRFYNADSKAQRLNLSFGKKAKAVWLVNLAEQREEKLGEAVDCIELSVPKKKIVSYELEF